MQLIYFVWDYGIKIEKKVNYHVFWAHEYFFIIHLQSYHTMISIFTLISQMAIVQLFILCRIMSDKRTCHFDWIEYDIAQVWMLFGYGCMGVTVVCMLICIAMAVMSTGFVISLSEFHMC